MGYQPICFIANGLKHYILDGVNRRQGAGFYSQEELQYYWMDRRHLQTTGGYFLVKPETIFLGRYYQKHAITSVCETFSNNRRQALGHGNWFWENSNSGTLWLVSYHVTIGSKCSLSS